MSLTMFRVRENAAATLIQSLFRGYKCRQWYKIITQLRLAAVIKIQSNFRLIKFLKVGPKIRRAKRNAAVTTVQKYMRGWLTHKHTLRKMMETKIEECFDFFQSVKSFYQVNAVIRI